MFQISIFPTSYPLFFPLRSLRLGGEPSLNQDSGIVQILSPVTVAGQLPSFTGFPEHLNNKTTYWVGANSCWRPCGIHGFVRDGRRQETAPTRHVHIIK